MENNDVYPYPFWLKTLLVFGIAFLGLTVLDGLQNNFTSWSIYDPLVPVVGQFLPQLNHPLNQEVNGSGDSSWQWAALVTQLLVGVVLTGIYLAIDRKPRNYDRPFEYFWVLLRYFLLLNMFIYGFAKVFHMQMPAPSVGRLAQPYGESSPMGLLWTFVGYSKYYSAYVGWAEVIPGVLLLFRRTTLLGALMAAVVMLNVFVLNMCFDVPVKIFSFLLFVMAVIIALPDLSRLWKILITHEAVPAREIKPFFSQKKWQTVGLVLKALLLLGMVGGQIFFYFLQMSKPETKPLLHGLWDVKEIQRNHQTVAPLLTDSTYWRKFMVNWEGQASIKMANDSLRRFEFALDSNQTYLNIHPRKDPANQYRLRIERPADHQMVLSGLWGGDSVWIRMERYDEQQFLLVRRGFHWVNETPFNR